jgi:Skp family chaperone for outer membrane proteins
VGEKYANSGKQWANSARKVGEMQAKLLQKVEELTLYMIELKKENELLKKANQQKDSEIKRKDNEIKKLKDEFDKNSLVWSATKKKEAESVLQAKQDTLQQFVDTTFGQNGKAERRMAELSKPIRDRIVGIIRRVAIENDFEMVLDAANVSIAFAKENLDLTDEVMAEIAKEK